MTGGGTTKFPESDDQIPGIGRPNSGGGLYNALRATLLINTSTLHARQTEGGNGHFGPPTLSDGLGLVEFLQPGPLPVRYFFQVQEAP